MSQRGWKGLATLLRQMTGTLGQAPSRLFGRTGFSSVCAHAERGLQEDQSSTFGSLPQSSTVGNDRLSDAEFTTGRVLGRICLSLAPSVGRRNARLDDAAAQSALLAHQFVAGLPETIRTKVLELNQSATIDAALDAARRLMALHSPPLAPAMPPLAHATPQPTSATPNGAYGMPPIASTMSQIQPPYQQMADVLSQQMQLSSTLVDTMQKMSKKLDQLSLDSQGRNMRVPSRFDGICYNCGQYGHIQYHCNLPRVSEGLAKRNTSAGKNTTHSVYTVPSRKSNHELPAAGVPASADLSQPTAVYVNAEINGRNHRCMLDTGAGVSLMPPNFGIVAIDTRKSIPLECANGAVIQTQGTTNLRVALNGAETIHTFHVADVTTGVILGADFLRSNGIDIQFSCMELTWP